MSASSASSSASSSTLGPFDYVYHCAAEFGRWNGEDFYETLWRTNADRHEEHDPPAGASRFRLIHFSSSEVYGDWPELMVETVMDEYEIKQLNDYAMTKWVNEMQIRNSATQYGTETVVVRLFNTYGPGEYYSPYRSVNCRFLYCALHGPALDGLPRPLTHVDLPRRHGAHAREHHRQLQARRDLQHRRRRHCTRSRSSRTSMLNVTGADPALVRVPRSPRS